MGARHTDVNSILFPVLEQPVFHYPWVTSESWDGQSADEGGPCLIPGLKAIVDAERNHVFAVVSEEYRLVHNRDALGFAAACFEAVFQMSRASMEIFNIIMPTTRSLCHVDFIPKGATFGVARDDAWTPFLRVTNSYNRSRSLRFDIGFCRWICTNGMIFGKHSISFDYPHTNRNLRDGIQFRTPFAHFSDIQRLFIDQMNRLRAVVMPHALHFALACYVFDITFDSKALARPERLRRLMSLRERIQSLSSQYSRELGHNAYAALNTLSDYASNPYARLTTTGSIDSLQQRIGSWLDPFLEAAARPGFRWESYLGEYLSQVALLPVGESSELF